MATPSGGMDGTLFRYDPLRNLVAFVSFPPPLTASDASSSPGDASAVAGAAAGAVAADSAAASPPGVSAYLILLGGLTDGLLPTPYTPALAAAVGVTHRVATVQATLRSSYTGYGVASLATDAEDIAALVAHLAAMGHPSGGKGEGGGGGGPAPLPLPVFILGHSTGCQSAVTYARGDPVQPPAGVILQAPVSDRQSRSMDGATAPRLAAAIALIRAGRGRELLPRLAGGPAGESGAAVGDHSGGFGVERLDGGTPMTADRFFSLAGAAADGAADDLFSTDMDARALAAGGLGALAPLPVLVLWSAADEYAGPSAKDWAPPGGTMPARLIDAMGGDAPGATKRVVVLAGADHAVSGATATAELVAEVVAFVGQVLEEGAGRDART
ncbi:hypothetical protein MMPV_003128 [Pyropia vietnamensis]